MIKKPYRLRPRLHEYVFNENATVVLHLHGFFVALSYRFHLSTRKRWKRLKTARTSGKLLFACQDNLNNLWLLLHRFQKFAFSVKTIRLHDNDVIITISYDNDIIITISLSNLSTLETVFKSYSFQSFSCRCKVCWFDGPRIISAASNVVF